MIPMNYLIFFCQRIRRIERMVLFPADFADKKRRLEERLFTDYTDLTDYTDFLFTTENTENTEKEFFPQISYPKDQ